MAYTITIDGEDRTGDVVARSVSISDVINDQVNTCTLSLVDLASTGIPNPGEEITIVDNNDDTIFGGYITKVSLNDKQNAGVIINRITCVDYVWLLDQNLVSETYESMTDAEIIGDIIDRYCAGTGITYVNVVSGVTIDQISFNYLQPSQCLRQICDLTGRNWYIDYDKDVHYFPLATITTPFNITDQSTGTVYLDEELDNSDNSGTMGGNATQEALYVELTDAVNDQTGHVYWSDTLSTAFTVEFGFDAGSGTGADATYFFWGCSSIPNHEDENPGGYLVAYDEYTNQIQIKFAGVLLSAVTQNNIDDGGTHDAKIIFDNNTVDVWLDGESKLEYHDIERSLPGTYYGLGARTGGLNNIHNVYDLTVYDTYTNSIDFANFNLSKDVSQIKNRVYIRGGTKLSDFTTYNELGDGEKKEFVIPDKPHDISIEVNGSPETVGIKHINTSGFDWYVNFQEKYVEQDSGGAVLTSSDTLEVTYKYDIPILVAVEDSASIAEYGQREYAIFDKTITTTQQARDRASAELTDYANDLIEASFTTMTAGFVSGMYINVNLTAYSVNENYIVQNVRTKSLGAGLFEYQISLASAKTLGIIRFLIELLEANKNLIELDENEVVDELFQLSDALLDDSLTDDLITDSTGAYHTWVEDSPSGDINTRGRWNMSQWG